MGLTASTGAWRTPDPRWIRTLLVVAVPGVLLAVLNLPTALTLVVGSLAFGLVATAVYACGTDQGPPTGSGRRSVRNGAQATFIFMGLIGFLSASVGLALLVAAALVLTSPLITGRPPTSGASDVPGPSGPAPHQCTGPVPDDSVLRLPLVAHLLALSDGELCLEWRRSFVVLQATTSPLQRARVVSIRQALLDEMERRHPAALHTWLASGGRAASGPDRYMVASTGDDKDRPERV